MKNTEIPPFYIGQEVVAIRDHEGWFKKGDEFRITSITPSQCACPGWEVTIGITDGDEFFHCDDCGQLCRQNVGEIISPADHFRPKLEIKTFISMKELAEQGLLTISGN